MAASPSAPAEEQGFDQVLQQLRQIVERLEGGNLSLEQSLAAFEEGVRLSRQGAKILDSAEQRVEILLRDEGGALRSAPFANPPSPSASPSPSPPGEGERGGR